MSLNADKKRWDDLHAAYQEKHDALYKYEVELGAKYGHHFQSSWLSSAQRNKLAKLRAAQDKIGDKIVDLLVQVSPRGETWLSGVPAWWLREKLTWEDAIRPANEPLSVVVPGSYGSHDGYVKEEQEEAAMEIIIPKMDMWEQISGDVSPGAYGGLLARSDGDALELLEIQPVREFVGDDEAADVGFPFWTKTAYYNLDDLDPNEKDTRSALDSSGLEDDALEEMSPTQRALAIAEALMRWGSGVDEGEGGWSKDVVPGRVKWWGGTIAGPEYLADDDDEFRRDVLGEEDEEEEEAEETEVEEKGKVSEKREIAKVRVWWDDQDPNNEGWYAMTYDAKGYEITDSQKIWFPVNVDDFSSDEADELHDALEEAFPDAEVDVED